MPSNFASLPYEERVRIENEFLVSRNPNGFKKKLSALRIKLKAAIRSLNQVDDSFERAERCRLRQFHCRANLRGVPSRGQALYEAKHHPCFMPFQSLPTHVKQSFETYADSGRSGYRFRGNKSAYRRWM